MFLLLMVLVFSLLLLVFLFVSVVDGVFVVVGNSVSGGSS